MSREITSHKLNGLNDAILVQAVGPDGPGGAPHDYLITGGDAPVSVHFQQGPVQEVGPNGISNEALIAVVIDRLQSFQKGTFSCRENAIALTKLEEAMHWLHHRTRQRLARGVEGTSNL